MHTHIHTHTQTHTHTHTHTHTQTHPHYSCWRGGGEAGTSYLRVVLRSVYTHQYYLAISTLPVREKTVTCQICSFEEN